MNPITPSVTTSQTSSSSSTSGSTSTTTAANGTTNSSQALDKNTFLKLMMVQMQNQDPLNPSDPTSYIGELAQLTTLEQTTNMAQSASQTAAEQHTAAALALLGHQVSYTDSNGNSVTGTVQKVGFTNSGPTLTIDGQTGIDPSKVDEVS
jgi:flagellar basal-body rod modification protein FlgD